MGESQATRTLGACYSVIRYIMFGFNLLFWILGIIIIAIGIYVLSSQNFGNAHGYRTGPILMIIVGLIILVTGFLGCFGAIRESQCLLFLFFLTLFFVFVLLMSAGIWAVAQREKIKVNLRTYLSEQVANYRTSTECKDVVDFVQKRFTCCGVSGPSDYAAQNPPIEIPKSCGNYPRDMQSRGGCYPRLLEFGRRHLYTVAGAAIGIGVIMIFGMVFSMMLCCALKEING